MTFKSNAVLFRPTTMGDAFQRLIGGTAPYLVRENLIDAIVRSRHDKTNSHPSIRVPIVPVS